jgi:glucose-1-phosphate cytidylyltransferase
VLHEEAQAPGADVGQPHAAAMAGGGGVSEVDAAHELVLDREAALPAPAFPHVWLPSPGPNIDPAPGGSQRLCRIAAMQVVILCGGRGTRLGRESVVIPKPMVPIDDRPILWHIMRTYAHFGHKDFILCLGYKGEVVKDYFLQYEARQNDVTVELGSPARVSMHLEAAELGWRVTLVDTGLDTATGARVRRAAKYLRDDLFLLTYGDGVADIDLDALVRFHRGHGRIATVTAVHPPARFGELVLEDGVVSHFAEKPQVGSGMINGGFFVFDRRLLPYLEGDDSLALEQEPLLRLTREGQLMGYRHEGFWQCMDTVRELTMLRDLWERGQAPWRRW